MKWTNLVTVQQKSGSGNKIAMVTHCQPILLFFLSLTIDDGFMRSIMCSLSVSSISNLVGSNKPLHLASNHLGRSRDQSTED
jgi:hypothetical protein